CVVSNGAPSHLLAPGFPPDLRGAAVLVRPRTPLGSRSAGRPHAARFRRAARCAPEEGLEARRRDRRPVPGDAHRSGGGRLPRPEVLAGILKPRSSISTAPWSTRFP